MSHQDSPTCGFDLRPSPVEHNYFTGALLTAISDVRETNAQWALHRLYQSADRDPEQPVVLTLPGPDLQFQYGRFDLPDQSATLLWFEDNSCLVARRRGIHLDVHPVVLQYTAPESRQMASWGLHFDNKVYPEAAREIPLFLSPYLPPHPQMVKPADALKGTSGNQEASQLALILAAEIRSWSKLAQKAPALLPLSTKRPRRGVHQKHGAYDWPNAIPFVGWTVPQAEDLQAYLNDIAQFLLMRHAPYCGSISLKFNSQWASQGGMQHGFLEVDATWSASELAASSDFNIKDRVWRDAEALMQSALCPVSQETFVQQRTVKPSLGDIKSMSPFAKTEVVAEAYVDDLSAASHHQHLRRLKIYSPVLSDPFTTMV